MKKFSDDLAEDREFEIGGELFKWRYPHWEETAAIFDEDVNILQSTNGDNISVKDTVSLTQQRIEVFLDPGNDAKKRWGALVKRKNDPVPLHQFSDLYRWLLEVTSGRPTPPPSDSAPGGGPTEASSPAESPSPAATRRR